MRCSTLSAMVVSLEGPTFRVGLFSSFPLDSGNPLFSCDLPFAIATDNSSIVCFKLSLFFGGDMGFRNCSGVFGAELEGAVDIWL